MLKTITKSIFNTFSKTLTVREALNSALDDELARDPKVFVIGE